MTKFKFLDWNKKRTMLRFIRAGDIFYFQISDNKFGVGRIISKVSIGHSAEIFNHFSNAPHISEKSITSLKKPFLHLILDSYSLFDKKYLANGELQVIKMSFHQIVLKVFILFAALQGLTKKSTSLG